MGRLGQLSRLEWACCGVGTSQRSSARGLHGGILEPSLTRARQTGEEVHQTTEPKSYP